MPMKSLWRGAAASAVAVVMAAWFAGGVYIMVSHPRLSWRHMWFSAPAWVFVGAILVATHSELFPRKRGE